MAQCHLWHFYHLHPDGFCHCYRCHECSMALSLSSVKDTCENQNTFNFGFWYMLCSHCANVLSMPFKWPQVTECRCWRGHTLDNRNNIYALREHNLSDSDLQMILFTDEQISDITIHCSDTYCNRGVQVLIHHVAFCSAHVLIPCNINFAERNDIPWHWLSKDTHNIFRSPAFSPWAPSSEIKLADTSGVHVWPRRSIFILHRSEHFYL